MPDTVPTYTARVPWTGDRGAVTTNRHADGRDTDYPSEPWRPRPTG